MTTPRSRPASVTLAFVLFLLQLLVAIGTLVVSVVIEQSQRTAESLGAGPIWNGSFALIVPVLELIVVFKMRSGHNWARVVLTILAVLSLLVNGFGLVTSVGVPALALAGVSLLVTLVALIAMYTRSANAYFRRR